MQGHTLRATEGPAAGSVIPTDAPVVIGRNAAGPGGLAGDPELSGQHARIYEHAGRLVVEDLGSTNGTFVNDERVTEPRYLAAGDRVRVGKTMLTLEAAAPSAPASAPPPAPVAPHAAQPGQTGARSNRKPLLIAAAAVLGLLALGGIAYALLSGGGDDETARPEPKRPIEETVERLERAVDTGSCKEFEQFQHDDLGDQKPGTSAADCDLAKKQMAELRNFTPGKSRELGTGAVTDGKLKGEDWAIVWALDSDGLYKIVVYFSVTSPQVGTEPRGNDFDDNAEGFITAVREQDCDGVWRHLHKDSIYVTVRKNDKQRFCTDLKGAYKAKDGFFRGVVDNPDAEPKRLGATQDIGVFGLQVAGTYYSVILTDSFQPTPEHENFGVENWVRAER